MYYFLVWITIGLMTGWLTGKLVKEGGYGPIVNIVMGIAGAVGGGSIMRLASSPEHSGLAYTSLAAILGALIVAGIVLPQLKMECPAVKLDTTERTHAQGTQEL